LGKEKEEERRAPQVSSSVLCLEVRKVLIPTARIPVAEEMIEEAMAR
jgi:hypothetical protein